MSNMSLPYPVLGHSDDVFPLLTNDCVNAQIEKTTSEYVFTVSLNQENSEIEQLIRNGCAEYACEVTCTKTYMRKCYHFSSPNFTINLKRTDVSGRVNFKAFVAAKEPIKEYRNSQFNEDYQGFSFDLEIGDLLVVFPLFSYNVDIRYDKLFAAGSFMQIVEAAQDATMTTFNLEGDKIRIEMPHSMFEQYGRFGNKFPEVIHSSLVHNALVYALSRYENYIDKGNLWADSLKYRLETETELQGLDMANMNDVFKAADILLKDPYKRLLDHLEQVCDNANEEED